VAAKGHISAGDRGASVHIWHTCKWRKLLKTIKFDDGGGDDDDVDVDGSRR
jgi:hypothetical protein